MAIFLIIASIITAGIILKHNNNSFGLRNKGTLSDNISEFNVNADTQHTSVLSNAYLNKVFYEIVDIDKNSMTAAVDFYVPDISNELTDIIDEILAENPDSEYDQLLAVAKEKLESALESEDCPRTKTTINLEIMNTDDGYKLIPNDEWNSIVYGGIEELYIQYLKDWIGGLESDEMPQ